MAGRERRELFHATVVEVAVADHDRTDALLDKVAKAGSRSPPVLAFATRTSGPTDHGGFYYTPKHRSWLDLAESEIGLLASQCLDSRIPDKQTRADEIAAWEHDRSANHAEANWQFATPNAGIKLKHLYPSI
jgi:hypothetical protein